MGLVVLWILTLLGRHQLAPSAPVAATALVLPWLYFGAALLFGAVAAWRPMRRPAVGLLGLVLASAVLLWGSAWVPMRAGSTGTDLRFISWNVARLGEFAPASEQPGAEAEALACVAGALRREAPDAVVLLEISRRRLAVLETELGYECEMTDYYNTQNPRHGGLAVCVPTAGSWTAKPRGARSTIELPPDWHAVFAELVGPGGTVNVLAVHFRPYGITADDLTETASELSAGSWRRTASLVREVERAVAVQGQQVHEVVEVLGTFQDPTVLAGDFNGTPDFAVHVALRSQMVDTWRRAGFGPGATRVVGGWLPVRIDYIYASPRLPPRRARRLPDRCSDHRGLAATLAVEGAR